MVGCRLTNCLFCVWFVFVCVPIYTYIITKSASFGPFDRQVVILNTDGTTFTVLENPQAMRLKKAGFIEDRRFVKQPSLQDLEDAKDTSKDGGMLGGLVQGLFGSGDGGD